MDKTEDKDECPLRLHEKLVTSRGLEQWSLLHSLRGLSWHLTGTLKIKYKTQLATYPSAMLSPCEKVQLPSGLKKEAKKLLQDEPRLVSSNLLSILDFPFLDFFIPSTLAFGGLTLPKGDLWLPFSTPLLDNGHRRIPMK